MKFDCGETWSEKKERLGKWHRHFAWWPVSITSHDCRWLEFVERKGELFCFYDDCGWAWEYRAIEKEQQ